MLFLVARSSTWDIRRLHVVFASYGPHLAENIRTGTLNIIDSDTIQRQIFKSIVNVARVGIRLFRRPKCLALKTAIILGAALFVEVA